MPADFVAPQFQNPDLLGSYLRGQQGATQAAAAPIELAGAQQDQQYKGLQMDQLRQTMAQQGLIQQYARQLAGQQGAPGAPGQSQGAQPAGDPGATASAGTGSPQGFNQPSVNTMMALDVLQGRDPLKSAQYAQQNVLEQKKLQLQGPINLAQRVATDPQANIVVANNPQLLQGFKQWAAQRGLNPNDPTVLTVANAQAAAKDYQSNLQGQLGEPSNVGFTGTLKPGEAAYQGGQQVAGDPNGMTAFDRGKLGIEGAHLSIDQQKLALEKGRQSLFSGPIGEIGAALAERGVSLPSGFRSQQQQASLYQGLMNRHPDMSADQIADLVKSGKIDLAGDLKEQTTAGGIVGKVKYAENELTQSIPLALESSKNVSRGSFMPLNKLLQMGDASISDPALRDLKIKTQSVMNAYDMLAARSGTDVAKRDAAHQLLASADSPAAYETALKAFAQEAQVAHKAGDMSMGRTPAASPGAAPPMTNSKGWVLHADAKGNKAYVSPDGKQFEEAK